MDSIKVAYRPNMRLKKFNSDEVRLFKKHLSNLDKGCLSTTTDIAAELTWRDIKIKELSDLIDKIKIKQERKTIVRSPDTIKYNLKYYLHRKYLSNFDIDYCNYKGCFNDLVKHLTSQGTISFGLFSLDKRQVQYLIGVYKRKINEIKFYNLVCSFINENNRTKIVFELIDSEGKIIKDVVKRQDMVVKDDIAYMLNVLFEGLDVSIDDKDAIAINSALGTTFGKKYSIETLAKRCLVVTTKLKQE